MDRNIVIRATELTIAGLVILVSILGLMATMYGMKYFKMMALDYAAVSSYNIVAVAAAVAIVVVVKQMQVQKQK